LYKRYDFATIRKAAARLDEFYKTGTLKWRRLPGWRPITPLLPYFEKLLSDFSLYLNKNCQYRSTTICCYMTNSRYFLSFLEQNKHVNLSQITLKDVSDFLPVIAPTHPYSMNTLLTSLRCFNRFLNDKKLSPIDIGPALIGVPAPRYKLQPFFTREEAEKIIAVIDRSSLKGKRDYAALLLAKNTGLRCCDICNLKLNEINWDKQEIKLVQTKTKVPLTLPLEAELGNAIADYILNARPSIDSPFVFVRTRVPFTKISSNAFRSILGTYMKTAGVKCLPGERKLMHAFRRGLGTRMLEAKIPLPTISNILGHTNIDSTRPYLATDFKQLQCCAIGLSDIPVSQEALR
jgi:integrase